MTKEPDVWLLLREEFNTVLAATMRKTKILGKEARAIKETAKTLARVHKITGEYGSSIEVSQRGADWFVNANDPAATHIEFGHRLSGKPRTPNILKGKVDKEAVDWVKGLHIMRNAALAHRAEHAGRLVHD